MKIVVVEVVALAIIGSSFLTGASCRKTQKKGGQKRRKDRKS
ncbi:hypothetical protein CSUI_008023 [Cystoisospora suis]|uniref:Uncharacterized protein n=1 Tax=Cystoisospora suis TaxID=483139 RepID=A0A2C6KBE5_9APIC|nr:hypothetical protein CSUI_008023 [Cystoisospora suis]